MIYIIALRLTFHKLTSVIFFVKINLYQTKISKMPRFIIFRHENFQMIWINQFFRGKKGLSSKIEIWVWWELKKNNQTVLLNKNLYPKRKWLKLRLDYDNDKNNKNFRITKFLYHRLYHCIFMFVVSRCSNIL